MSNTYIRRQFSDTVSYTDQLSGGINNSVTSFTLKDGSTFPNGSVGPFVVTIDPDTGTEEKILCASRSGSSFTVASSGRGYGGTTAVAHGANAPVIHTICAQDLDEANQVVANTLGKITTAGDLLYAATATTLARLGIGSANQVVSSSGTVPQWSTLLGLIEDQFTSANQVILGTGSGTGALTDILTAVQNKLTADNQLIAGTGSGTGELITILALLEEQFTAANQVLLGTGNGTGALTDILTALENKFTAAGQVIVGTGSGTGELFNPFPVANVVATSQTTASTAYTDLATAGPAVTVTTGTSALVTVTSQVQNNGSAFVGYAVSGASTVAAADTNALEFQDNSQHQASATFLQTGLTAGSNTFTAKYRVVANTGTFANRNIIVQPLP